MAWRQSLTHMDKGQAALDATAWIITLPEQTIDMPSHYDPNLVLEKLMVDKSACGLTIWRKDTIPILSSFRISFHLHFSSLPTFSAGESEFEKRCMATTSQLFHDTFLPM